MADTQENKYDEVSYEESPLRFYLSAYKSADRLNEALKERVVSSRLFYEGFDQDLEDRKARQDVIRSAEFIPELSTAIDTRQSTVDDRIDGDDMPVRLRIADGVVEPDGFNEVLRKKEEELNRQLRESGYLQGQNDQTSVYQKQFIGAELQPVSVIKIGYEVEEGWIPKVETIKPNPMKVLGHMLRFQTMPPPESRTGYTWGVVKKGIYTDWLDHDEILYDPSAVKPADMRFIIHRAWKSWNELVEIAAPFNAIDKLEEIKHKAGDNDGSSGDTTSEEVSKKLNDDESPVVFRDGKYCLCEFWFWHYDKISKQKVMRRMYVVSHKVIIIDQLSPLRLKEFPFHFKKSHPQLGKMEGRTSVEIAKPSQKIYSDLYNCMLDYLSYGSLGELWLPTGFNLTNPVRRGPGALNYCSDPAKMLDLRPDVGVVQYILLLIEKMADKLRQQLNAPDIDQGVGQPAGTEEKAIKTRLRSMGTAKRQRPLLKAAADDIITVAEVFIEINIQNDPSWVFPVPVEVTVPVLSGVYTPDEEFEQSVMIYQQAMTNPLYGTPIGQMKLRQLWIDVLTKARIKDIDSRCPTEQELAIANQLMEMLTMLSATKNGAGAPGNGVNGDDAPIQRQPVA